MNKDLMDKKYALVFSGGGARGAYEMGVWKAIDELEITVDAVAGTSIGSINGALLAQYDFVQALNVWNELSPEMVFDTDISGLDKYRDVSKIKSLLEKYIDEKKIRKSSIQFALVTYNLSDLTNETVFTDQIPEGKLIDYIMASANHPIFKRYKIDGKLYIDGGVYNNLPAKPLVEKGYHNLIIVDVRDPLAMTVQKFDKSETFIIDIKPKNNLRGVMNFSKDSIQENLIYGYYDTMKAFGKYKGSLYYILEDDLNDEFMFTPNDLKKLTRDKFFLKLFDNHHAMISLLKSVNEFSQADRMISIFSQSFFVSNIEICAEILGVNRCAEYTVSDLCEKLINEFNDIILKEKYLETNIKKRIVEKFINKEFSLDNEDKKLVFAAMLNSMEIISNHYELISRFNPKLIVSYLVANVMLNRLNTVKA